MKSCLQLLVLLAFAVAAVPTQAVTLSVYDANNLGTQDLSSFSGLSDFSATVQYDSQLGMNVIDIYETWVNDEITFIRFEGLDLYEDYLVRKHVVNETGVDWLSFNHELLDPSGQAEDNIWDRTGALDYDLPSGWSTSNDQDGLSFAQGSNVPRTSTQYTETLVDELTDERDFIEFMGGVVRGTGAVNERSDVMTFGLADRSSNWSQQDFLLAQRTNVNVTPPPPIPEPATLLLIGSGLVGGAVARRRRKR